jgi:hypothetical protein
LKNITEKAESIQIFLENNLGKSEASEYFEIKCGFKGCIKTDSTGAIVGGVIAALIVAVFVAGFIYYKRFLRNTF